jgi:hypothetical protein
MASALLYLRLLHKQIEFTRDRRSKNILIYDNEGLLIRILEAVQWSYTPPNVTLRAEWDIESVILETYRQLNFRFDFKHVKSHQDDDAPVASLSLATRLNIKADRLATEYVQEDLHRRPIAALFPSAKAQLIINGKLITHKIPQVICFAVGSLQIRQYLMERN